MKFYLSMEADRTVVIAWFLLSVMLPSGTDAQWLAIGLAVFSISVKATTAMQAVILCKRASKPSDPLDRDPTVGHI
jgi:hypothetical protein